MDTDLFKQKYDKKIVTFDGSRGFDHGCQDWARGKIVAHSDDHLICLVFERQSCHSCWQVGHDADHQFMSEPFVPVFRDPVEGQFNWYLEADEDGDLVADWHLA